MNDVEKRIYFLIRFLMSLLYQDPFPTFFGQTFCLNNSRKVIPDTGRWLFYRRKLQDIFLIISTFFNDIILFCIILLYCFTFCYIIIYMMGCFFFLKYEKKLSPSMHFLRYIGRY